MGFLSWEYYKVVELNGARRPWKENEIKYEYWTEHGSQDKIAADEPTKLQP